MKTIMKWLIHSGAIYFAAWLIPGIEIKNFWTALLVSVVLSLINVFLKPILMLFSLPFILLSFGLFLLVINAVLLAVAGSLAPGFEVLGFWPAFQGAFIISLVSFLLNPPDRKPKSD